MTTARVRSSIPAAASEVVEERFPDGSKKSASYFVDGKKVGVRSWYENGNRDFEYALKNDHKHGNEYYFYQNGKPLEVTPYWNGTIHGTGKQWAEDGSLLVTYQCVHGVGLDLWCDILTGTLSEETYRPGDEELGYSRLWNPDERTIWKEYYYLIGKGYHGIWREWNSRGRLRRAYPQYYINGNRVTKRQYSRACLADPTLPALRAEEDQPERRLPEEYLAQKKAREGNWRH